jgi:signal transduction histidine kinase
VSSARQARAFEQFSRNRLFEGVEPEIFDSIRAHLNVLRVRKDQIIFREGDPGDSLYLVGEGLVTISKRPREGEPETLGLVESGNFFGGTALLEGEPRSSMAVATAPSVLGTIKEETFQKILELAPSRLHINFLRSINQRMRSVNAYFMNEVLRAERLRVVGAVAHSILHDLKNPACIARCCSDLIATETTDPRLLELTSMLGNAVNGLLSTTQDLVDYTRDCIFLQKQHVSIWRVLDELSRESLRLLPGKNIEFIKHIRYDGDLDVDPARFVRVLSSLIKNACEAMSNGGIITITADLVQSDVVLRISDTGPGMPAEYQRFEPFSAHEMSHGTGLSLAMAKSVVEAHGGKISIASVPGKGSTVDIRLPKPVGE